MEPPSASFLSWRNAPLCPIPALIALSLLLTGASCRSRQPATAGPEHSFYYWRSVFVLTPKERQTLHSLQVTRLYTKFFDVTWDESAREPRPVATIRFKDSATSAFNIVPVVFITNGSLLHLDTGSVRPLAGHIAKLVTELTQQNNIPPPKEIQLDCDWSAATKDTYFMLIGDIRHWLNDHGQKDCRLSATIRLYQCKYREKTGVPPVDKGLLMCYNMGNLKDPGTTNSILETKELEKYITGLRGYPLPLDLALPLFDWKVLFRHEQYAGLISSLPSASLTNNPAIRSGSNSFTGSCSNSFFFTRDTSIDHYSFEAGDRLRDERSDYPQIAASARLLARKLQHQPSTIILYHLDSSNLSKYSNNELENIFDTFN